MDKQLVLFENKNILDQEKFPSRKTRMIKVECNQKCMYSLQSALVPIWGIFFWKKEKLSGSLFFNFMTKMTLYNAPCHPLIVYIQVGN